MLRLQTVQKKDRDLLWNVNQKYLYEMTNFYDDPTVLTFEVKKENGDRTPDPASVGGQ